KILEGRDFTVDDADSKQPVAIVNASFARKYWGNQSALGHQVRIFNPGKAQPWRTIVGVVPDTLMQGPFDQQTEAAGRSEERRVGKECRRGRWLEHEVS